MYIRLQGGTRKKADEYNEYTYYRKEDRSYLERSYNFSDALAIFYTGFYPVGLTPVLSCLNTPGDTDHMCIIIRLL